MEVPRREDRALGMERGVGCAEPGAGLNWAGSQAVLKTGRAGGTLWGPPQRGSRPDATFQGGLMYSGVAWRGQP